MRHTLLPALSEQRNGYAAIDSIGFNRDYPVATTPNTTVPAH